MDYLQPALPPLSLEAGYDANNNRVSSAPSDDWGTAALMATVERFTDLKLNDVKPSNSPEGATQTESKPDTAIRPPRSRRSARDRATPTYQIQADCYRPNYASQDSTTESKRRHNPSSRIESYGSGNQGDVYRPKPDVDSYVPRDNRARTSNRAAGSRDEITVQRQDRKTARLLRRTHDETDRLIRKRGNPSPSRSFSNELVAKSTPTPTDESGMPAVDIDMMGIHLNQLSTNDVNSTNSHSAGHPNSRPSKRAKNALTAKREKLKNKEVLLRELKEKQAQGVIQSKDPKFMAGKVLRAERDYINLKVQLDKCERSISGSKPKAVLARSHADYNATLGKLVEMVDHPEVQGGP